MICKIKSLLNSIRNIYIFNLKYRWVEYGKNVHCKINNYFWSPHNHTILGNNVGIGVDCHIHCDIEIGSNVLIASCCAFLNSDDHNHKLVGKTIWDSGRGDKYKIIISDDVWIGHGAIILTPAKVGRGAIVSAGSVVVKDVPPYSIVGGVPARVISWRFSANEIVEHERILIQNGDMEESDRTDISSQIKTDHA